MDTEELLHNLRIRRRILGIVAGTALIVLMLWVGTVTYAIIHNERIAHGYGVLGGIEVIDWTEYETAPDVYKRQRWYSWMSVNADSALQRARNSWPTRSSIVMESRSS